MTNVDRKISFTRPGVLGADLNKSKQESNQNWYGTTYTLEKLLEPWVSARLNISMTTENVWKQILIVKIL